MARRRRAGAVTSGADVQEVQWEAEFHLRHTPGFVGAAATQGGIPAAVAGLGVRAVRGVGAIWARRPAGSRDSAAELWGAACTSWAPWTRRSARASWSHG